MKLSTKLTAPKKDFDKINELKLNIDDCLTKIMQIEDDDICKFKELLDDCHKLIEECYFVDDFKTNRYRNFDMLVFELQKKSLKRETYEIDKKLETTKELINEVKKEIRDIKKDTKMMKGDFNSIIPVMLGVVLAISVIPAAIVGIEHINSNYILPFISTVVFCGMMMIVFIYSIYQSKLRIGTLVIISLFIIATIILWLMPWNFNISLTPRNITTQVQEIEAGSLN